MAANVFNGQDRSTDPYRRTCVQFYVLGRIFRHLHPEIYTRALVHRHAPNPDPAKPCRDETCLNEATRLAASSDLRSFLQPFFPVSANAGSKSNYQSISYGAAEYFQRYFGRIPTADIDTADEIDRHVAEVLAYIDKEYKTVVVDTTPLRRRHSG
jgi:hypothetical protein